MACESTLLYWTVQCQIQCQPLSKMLGDKSLKEDLFPFLKMLQIIVPPIQKCLQMYSIDDVLDLVERSSLLERQSQSSALKSTGPENPGWIPSFHLIVHNVTPVPTRSTGLLGHCRYLVTDIHISKTHIHIK